MVVDVQGVGDVYSDPQACARVWDGRSTARRQGREGRDPPDPCLSWIAADRFTPWPAKSSRETKVASYSTNRLSSARTPAPPASRLHFCAAWLGIATSPALPFATVFDALRTCVWICRRRRNGGFLRQPHVQRGVPPSLTSSLPSLGGAAPGEPPPPHTLASFATHSAAEIAAGG